VASLVSQFRTQVNGGGNSGGGSSSTTVSSTPAYWPTNQPGAAGGPQGSGGLAPKPADAQGYKPPNTPAPTTLKQYPVTDYGLLGQIFNQAEAMAMPSRIALDQSLNAARTNRDLKVSSLGRQEAIRGDIYNADRDSSDLDRWGIGLQLNNIAAPSACDTAIELACDITSA